MLCHQDINQGDPTITAENSDHTFKYGVRPCLRPFLCSILNKHFQPFFISMLKIVISFVYGGCFGLKVTTILATALRDFVFLNRYIKYLGYICVCLIVIFEYTLAYHFEL